MNENNVISMNIVVHPHYQTAHAQITEPTRFVAVSHYFRRRWLRQVGPVGTAILIELRGRCYNNPATGERRDTVVAAQRELAEAIGISVDTLQRQLGKPGRDEDLKANQALRCFIWTEERYERSNAGRVRQMENVYHVSMDDPIHSDDAARLEALVKDYEQQAQEADARQHEGRKQIVSVNDRTHPSTADAPKPQIAVLRYESKAEPGPLPQNAARGHRKMRQGSPQNAALSEDSLLFITREITNSLTLNVTEDAFDFVILEEKGNSLPLATSSRSALEASFDAAVSALIQELKDWGSERRHRQLFSVCEQHGLQDLPSQALLATRQRLARETKLGVLEKPGAYYQKVLIKLLADRQVFVPTLAEKCETAPEEVRHLVRASLGLLSETPLLPEN